MASNIKKLLKKNKLFQSFIKQSKKNDFAEIIMTSIEKWNFSDKPKTENEYDVIGKKWEDINVSYTYKLWKIKDFFRYIKNIIKYKDFKLQTERGLFSITSFEVIKWDLAEDIAYGIVPLDNVEFRFEKVPGTNYSKLMDHTPEEKKILEDYRKERDNQYNNITKDDLAKHILKSYSILTNGLYVSKEDPTCIVVDNDIYKYDFKDGWSDEKIGELIGIYLMLLEYPYRVIIKEDNTTYKIKG